jgi:hypothetical protein
VGECEEAAAAFDKLGAWCGFSATYFALPGVQRRLLACLCFVSRVGTVHDLRLLVGAGLCVNMIVP